MPIGRFSEFIAKGNEIAGVPIMLWGSVNWHTGRRSSSAILSFVTSALPRLYLPQGSATLVVAGDSQISYFEKYLPSCRRDLFNAAIALRNCSGFMALACS